MSVTAGQRRMRAELQVVLDAVLASEQIKIRRRKYCPKCGSPRANWRAKVSVNDYVKGRACEVCGSDGCPVCSSTTSRTPSMRFCTNPRCIWDDVSTEEQKLIRRLPR